MKDISLIPVTNRTAQDFVQQYEGVDIMCFRAMGARKIIDHFQADLFVFTVE